MGVGVGADLPGTRFASCVRACVRSVGGDCFAEVLLVGRLAWFPVLFGVLMDWPYYS